LGHLSKWDSIDSTEGRIKYAVLLLEREKRAARPGSMLKLLNALLKNKGDVPKAGIYPLTRDELVEARIKVLTGLGYTHLLEREVKWKLLVAPNDFTLF